MPSMVVAMIVFPQKCPAVGVGWPEQQIARREYGVEATRASRYFEFWSPSRLALNKGYTRSVGALKGPDQPGLNTQNKF